VSHAVPAPAAPEPIESAPALPAAAEIPAPHCLNCHAALHGPFCAQCGQEHVEGPMPVRAYLADGMNTLFEWWDDKVPRSLWVLVRRPGLLTREFQAGRRVAWLLPWRLYFLVSVVFFLLVNLLDPVTTASLGVQDMEAQRAEAMNRAIADMLPALLLGVVPFFTIGVWGLHRRRHPYYMQHLAFSFHYLAFVFLAFSVPVVVRAAWLWNVAMLGIYAYLVLALRQAYPQRAGAAAARAAVLFAYFWVLVLFAMVVGLMVAAIRTAVG
jgi:hypothetical protein